MKSYKCVVCNGKGKTEDSDPCNGCSGNGYILVDDELRDFPKYVPTPRWDNPYPPTPTLPIQHKPRFGDTPSHQPGWRRHYRLVCAV